nr:hypothetical protein [arborvitae Umbra-like virus]
MWSSSPRPLVVRGLLRRWTSRAGLGRPGAFSPLGSSTTPSTVMGRGTTSTCNSTAPLNSLPLFSGMSVPLLALVRS